MTIPYEPPVYEASSFNCPFCRAYANQIWTAPQKPGGPGVVKGLKVAQCMRCGEHSLWVHKKMVYPRATAAPPHNPDLPDDPARDYQEAANILNDSPRGAAALLRLVIEKLCKELGQPGKDLNTDIGKLVEQGLDPRVQKALDAVRVIGNEAVHPGQIDLRDKAETALVLFGLVNMIVDMTITRTNQIEAIYDSLPEAKRDQIERRDAKNAAGEGD